MENNYIIKLIKGLYRRFYSGMRRIIPRRKPASSVTIAERWFDIPQTKNWDTVTCTKRIRAGIWELNPAENDGESCSPVIEQHYEVFKLLGEGPKKLFDFGCGNGAMCQFLKQRKSTRDWSYTGADVNSALVQHCKKTNKGGEFFECHNGFLETIKTNSYDIVVACGSFQCIKETECCLAELARISSDMVVLSRLAVCETLKHSVITVQKVRHANGTEIHPVHLFAPGDVVRMALANNLVLVKQLKGAEAFRVGALECSLDLLAFRKSK